MSSVNEEDRTFESRLLFIGEIFNDPFPKDKIMTSCIQHKLDVSFEEYLSDVHKSYYKLLQKEPTTVLKRMGF